MRKKSTAYQLAVCVILMLLSPVAANAADSIVYTDPMSGTQINMSEQWSVVYEDVRVNSTSVMWSVDGTPESNFIIYRCRDVADKFNELMQIDLPRENLDGSLLTADEIAEVIGDILLQDYFFDMFNGIEYLCSMSSLHFSLDEYSVNSIKMTYHCIVDGYGYTFELLGYHGDGIFEAFEYMLGHVCFGGQDGWGIPDSENKYTFPLSGSGFSIPDGLYQIEDQNFSKDNSLLMAAESDGSARIKITCTDYYSTLSPYLQSKLSRLDADKQIADREKLLADQLGMATGEVTSCYYYGVQYHEISTPLSALDHSGQVYTHYFSLGVEHIRAVQCVYNGYIYYFIYYGTDDGPVAEMFDQLVKTVRHDRLEAMEADRNSELGTASRTDRTMRDEKRQSLPETDISLPMLLVFFVPLVLLFIVLKRARRR